MQPIYHPINYVLLFLFFTFFISTTVLAQTQLGNDIDGLAGADEIGYSVSMSADGNIIAVGAPLNDRNGGASGHVKIYQYLNAAWVQLGDAIEGEAAGDQFGYSVSLSDDGSTVAIGARYNDANNSATGNITIYKYNGIDWVQQGLDIRGMGFNEQVGESVSLNADGLIVAIGITGNVSNTANPGRIAIYAFDGSAWSQMGGDIFGQSAGDQFGYSVSLSADGNVVAAGAIDNDDNGISSGHVRVYSFSGSSWTQQGNSIVGEAADDQSGWSVSLNNDGSKIAIGSPYNEGINGFLSGHVRVYEYENMIWTQLGDDIDGDTIGDQSGYSVSLSSDGNTVAIGTPFGSGINATNSGYVRLYNYNGSSWNQLGNDIYGESAADLSGYSISLSSDGSRIAIGAPSNDGINGQDSGHVRVFQFATLELLDDQQPEIKIYPNPTNGLINICCINEAYHVKVFDQMGKQVMIKRDFERNESIDVSNLMSGIYLLEIILRDTIYTHKIVKD
jgi:hypothetical protein